MVYIIVNLIIFVAMVSILIIMQKRYIKFSKRVFLALGLGVVGGLLMQLLYGSDEFVMKGTLEWINIVGQGYVRLLQMIVMPLVMISIMSAIINLKEGGKDLGKMTSSVIGILIATAMIAAVVGIVTANLFHLNAEGLAMGANEAARAGYLESKLVDLNQTSFASRLINMIPTNPFMDMTGSRDTSTIGVVIFSAFLSVAALGIAKKNLNHSVSLKT